jgi:hypothetical protein
METKICTSCNEEKSVTEFYQQNDRPSKQSKCKVCFNKYCSERWIKTKIKAIEYKGGKCLDCSNSYPKSPYVIFDFHHRDPSQKDVEWTHLRKRSWDKIIKELDKCDLLCSNCHRIRHHNE